MRDVRDCYRGEEPTQIYGGTMLIQNIHVKNFRSILDESLPCDSLTALVGRNGSGKSSFLSALELFYNQTARVTSEDFYGKDVTQDIEIVVTYSNLNAEAKGLFSPYLDNGRLVVVRVFSDPQSGKSGTYHGMRLQNPDFADIRNTTAAMPKRNKYSEIREMAKYASLPSVSTADAVLQALTEWEAQNPGQCELLRDDGQFFGFTQVAQGFLGRYTKFIYVPAVRDALDDAIEKRGSSVTEIMDLVVRSALAKRNDVEVFKQHTQDEYRKVMNPQKLTELEDLAGDLSKTLQSYVPDAKVLLHWSELSDITIPMPEADVKLMEDDYESRVERTGHGLQRAFIITMLQHLNAARTVGSGPKDGTTEDNESGTKTIDVQLPSLVLAIEEPELYQHPSRQRHLASVLLNLAIGGIPGVANSTQVIYGTHSPLFVGLDRFDQIRVLRKIPQSNGGPRTTRLNKADMEAVANELWDAGGSQREKYTAESLQPRLQSIMTPWMGEGFFADVVVLVEGEDDRAAILGFAKLKQCNFDSLGITVIPCFGKSNIDRPLVIFRQLGISVYVVWDGDCGGRDAKAEDNKYILRLLCKPEEDWPHFVGDSAACFKIKLENTLEDEIGSEDFAQWLAEAQQKLGIAKKEHALKNPSIIEDVVKRAASNGKISNSLESIIDNIAALRG